MVGSAMRSSWARSHLVVVSGDLLLHVFVSTISRDKKSHQNLFTRNFILTHANIKPREKSRNSLFQLEKRMDRGWDDRAAFSAKIV